MNRFMNASRQIRSLYAAIAPPPRNSTRNANRLFTPPSFSARLRGRLDEWKHNGTPEIAFGVLVLGYAGVDHALGRLRARQRDDVLRQLERAAVRDGRASRARDRDRFLDAGGVTASRGQRVVRRVPRTLDGYQILTDARRGDVVDVIEEGVGPGGRYSFCALRRGARDGLGREGDAEDARAFSLGWFPNTCLQKIE